MKDFEKWFKKAENDLFTIKNLIDLKDAPYDVCCFHAQQAAEKYLKAYLIVRNVDFPKTHNLEMLVNFCIKFNQKFNKILNISIWLSEFGVSLKYPDDFAEAILQDAKQAYQNALTIKDFVITHFFE